MDMKPFKIRNLSNRTEITFRERKNKGKNKRKTKQKQESL